MFTLYPAIDLRGGQCVRLRQGDYNQETVYGKDPVEVAQRWEESGAEWLHLVDLDAARTGEPVNMPSIQAIVQAVNIPVQVGGGIRSHERIEELLQLGVERLILGSAAVENVELVKEALAAYGERIAIGVDAKDGYVATHGWLETSEVKAEVLARELVEVGARTFIFTDIARDGTLSGPNVDAVRRLAVTSGANVIASGGVSRLEDIVQLAQHEGDGVTGAVVGRALYTGDVVLQDALRAVASNVRDDTRNS